MVQPNTVLESIATAIRGSSLLSSEVTYSIVELDMDGEHADVHLPAVELTVQDVERDTSRNTEKIARVTNENDHTVGHIFEEWYVMGVQCDALTAAMDEFDPKAMVNNINRAFAKYDSHRMGRPLPDPDGGLLTDVSSIELMTRVPANDLSLSPSLRRERLVFDVAFEHRFSTVDIVGEADPITAIETPTDGSSANGEPETVQLDA